MTLIFSTAVHLLPLLLLLSLTVRGVDGLENLYGPNLDLTFTYGYDVTPDCVTRQPLVKVNGHWPPPTIHVKANDTITLRTTNKLVAVAFTVHIHGFDQVGTPWEDGTGMITTCPIIPDTESSKQVFQAPPYPGTYLYHGHVAHAKVAGFTGLVVVEPNPELGIDWSEESAHDEELELLIGDSYHGPSLPLLAGLLQPVFRWVGDPQSVLIQGQGYFNCEENAVYTCTDRDNELCESGVTSSDVCGAGDTVYYNTLTHCDAAKCPGRASLQVKTGKTYLIRVGNGGVSSLLNLIIEGHSFTVVSIDGRYVVPKQLSSIDLHVGQRATILLTADQPAKVYYISAGIRGRIGVRYGTALLEYDGLTDATKNNDETSSDIVAVRAQHAKWNDYNFTIAMQRQFEGIHSSDMPTKTEVDDTFFFLNTQEKFEKHDYTHKPKTDSSGLDIGSDLHDKPQCFCDDGYIKWAIKRNTFENPTTPLLHSMYYETETKSKEELEAKGYYELVEGHTYDIVLQNYPACNGACEVHPWHLHGHHFWHVGTFEGAYDKEVGYPEDGSGGSNYLRDTILLTGAEAQQGTCSDSIKPCGYTVIRFTADNPGVWFFHCHIDWHLIMGMAVAFYYRDMANTVPEPDLNRIALCGNVTAQKVIDRALSKGEKKLKEKDVKTEKKSARGSKKRGERVLR